MKKILKKFIFLLFLLLLTGYGYGVNDPLVTGFKEIGKKLSQGRWGQVNDEIQNLSGQIAQARKFSKTNLNNLFIKAVEQKDRQLLANTWIHLTLITARTHLWWSLKEKITDRIKAKARIDAIDRYLKDILGPQIKSQNTQLYKDIVNTVGDLRESLGSPGAFGLGAVKKDEKSFVTHSVRFDQLMWQAYPFARPAWYQEMLKRDDVISYINNLINQLHEDDDFIPTYKKLNQLKIALALSRQTNWQNIFMDLTSQMGQPKEGKEPERKRSKEFKETLEKLKKHLNK